MDPAEDVSARVLLKHVLYTEPPRSPVTRSSSRSEAQSSSSETRRSTRLRSNAASLTPQETLRRSLKHKLRASTSRTSMPPSKRRTVSALVRKSTTPAHLTASVLYDDAITPRHLLRNILRTEPEVSLLVQERLEHKEPEVPADSSLRSNRTSTGLDLPEGTMGNVVSTVKGLRRKRPRRSINVTAFEKQLEHGHDAGKEAEDSDELSSLSSTSLNSVTLSLKTPFVDVHTEKRGLQRRLPPRRKISVEEFGAAVHQRQMAGTPEGTIRGLQRALGETAHSEGFTLGLSDLDGPDITSDIINHNTALYPQPDSTGCQQEGEEEEVAEVKEEGEEEVAEVEEEEMEEDQRSTDREDAGRQEAEDVEVTAQQVSHDIEHISRRAHRSEGGVILPATVEGGRGYKSLGAVPNTTGAVPNTTGAVPNATEAGGAGDESRGLQRSEEWFGGPDQGGKEEEEEENSIPPLGLTCESENSSPPGGTTAHQEASQGPAQQEEEEEEKQQQEEEEEEEEEEQQQQQQQEEEEEDDEDSAEISMKTPAFVKQKRCFSSEPRASLAVLKDVQTREASVPVKPRKTTRPRKKQEPGLPKSYLMAVFRHFSRTRVSPDVYPVLQEIMDKFFDRLVEDLETYCHHAKRKTIEPEDVELLLRRQGHVNDKVPVEVLIEKYLPMEYRKLLIPVATRGNVVIPKLKR
ncbi:uncharacterized protein cenpt [Polymixia lowei]